MTSYFTTHAESSLRGHGYSLTEVKEQPGPHLVSQVMGAEPPILIFEKGGSTYAYVPTIEHLETHALGMEFRPKISGGSLQSGTNDQDRKTEEELATVLHSLSMKFFKEEDPDNTAVTKFLFTRNMILTPTNLAVFWAKESAKVVENGYSEDQSGADEGGNLFKPVSLKSQGWTFEI